MCVFEGHVQGGRATGDGLERNERGELGMMAWAKEDEGGSGVRDKGLNG